MLAVLPVAAMASMASAALVQGLGAAQGYSIFTFGNLTRSNSDTYGRVAVGGNATFSGYAIGSRLSSSDNTASTVVAGQLSYTNGTINGAVVAGSVSAIDSASVNSTLDVSGDVTNSGWTTFKGTVTVGGNWNGNVGLTANSSMRVGGTFSTAGSTNITGNLDVGGNKTTLNNPTINGTVRVNGQIDITGGGGSVGGGVQYGSSYKGPSYINNSKVKNAAVTPTPAASPVNFGAASSFFQSASQQWAALQNNGVNSLSWGNRTLTGTDSQLNVFNISASDLSGIYSLAINVPSGSTVLINVAGTSVTVPNVGITLNGSSLVSEGSGANYGSVLWNFPQATNISMNSLGGSMVAPLADVSFNSGQHNGVLVAMSSSGNGESHDYQFTGYLPSVGGGGAVPEPQRAILVCPLAWLVARRRR